MNGRVASGSARPRAALRVGFLLISGTAALLFRYLAAFFLANDVFPALVGAQHSFAVDEVILSPLFAAIALAIKLDSEGPVFFKQGPVRVGGRIFWIYKFRATVRDAEAKKGQLRHLNRYRDRKFFRIKDNPRVTRVGRFLLRTSLDELPQLIDVVRGEMSLVGLRPPVPDEVVGYSPHYLQRLAVAPGITGLWKINGRSDVLVFEEVVRLELEYINTWSIGRT
jgi:lipopolysaccharide/colanic/teichoic acid biosynthesis glycosyltransferase